MTTNTVLLILLSIVIAGGLSFFNIIIKPKQIKIEFVLAFVTIVVWDPVIVDKSNNYQKYTRNYQTNFGNCCR
jgi:hypothetical protein